MGNVGNLIESEIWCMKMSDVEDESNLTVEIDGDE